MRNGLRTRPERSTTAPPRDRSYRTYPEAGRFDFFTVWLPSQALQASSGGNRPGDGNQDAGPDERDADTTPEAGIPLHEQAEDQAAKEGADQADDDVQGDAVAAALHDH